MHAIAQRAGFDHEKMREVFTAHLDVDLEDELVDKVVDKLVPQLKKQEEAVRQAFQTCINQVQAKEDRLYCARGCARGYRFMLRVFVRCAAATPRGTKSELLMDQEPVYMQFRSRNPLFRELPLAV